MKLHSDNGLANSLSENALLKFHKLGNVTFTNKIQNLVNENTP